MSFNSCPFEIFDMDLWTSPISIPLGYKYYVLFLDDCTNFLWTFPLMHKSQFYDIFVNFHLYVQTQFALNIKSFQSNHGGEFDNNLFHTFFY